MQTLQGQVRSLLTELYEQSPPVNTVMAALLDLHVGDELSLQTVQRLNSELDRLQADKVRGRHTPCVGRTAADPYTHACVCVRWRQAARKKEVEHLISTIQSLWTTLGMQPETDTEQSVRRNEIAAFMSTDRLQRLKSKELLVRARPRCGRRSPVGAGRN
jgi:hypothetical protein